MNSILPGLNLDFFLVFSVFAYLVLFTQLAYLKPFSAAMVTCVKIIIPLAYFSGFMGYWTHLDDITYLKHANELLQSYSLFELTFSLDGYLAMMSISGGRHIVYVWWNVISQSLFGYYYFAPVLLNIVISSLAGLIFYKIVLLSTNKIRYSRNVAVFFILHIDVLTWSSLINIKGNLIIVLTLWAFYSYLRFDIKKEKLSLLLLLIPLWLLLWTRFYIPLLILVSIVTFHILVSRKFYLLIVSCIALGLIGSYFISMINFSLLNPFGLFSGAVRFALTPQPWSIVPEYKYLLPSSIYNYLMFIPMLMGGVKLWRFSKISRLLILYALICCGLYSILPELQGPRHRYQLVPVIAWAQYHFIYCVYNHLISRNQLRRNNQLTNLERKCVE